MRGTALIAMWALTGCDAVFDLQRPPADAPGPDAPIDAPPDAPPDAPEVCDDPSGVPDEDDDGLRNACDSCPQVPGAQLDTDGDGVGDGCDPRPGLQDTLIHFIGFDDDNHGLAFFKSPGPGMWSVAGSTLRTMGVAERQHMMARFNIALRDVSVTAGVTLATPHPAFEGESAGLWVNVATTPVEPWFPEGNVFELARTTLKFSHLVESRSTPPNSVNSSFNDELFVTGRRYELKLTCQGATSPTCTASSVHQPNSETVTISLPSAAVRTGAVGLRAYATDVMFHYLAIYRHGP